RRHTRSTRDWSSDVCSSDLAPPVNYSFVPTWAIFLGTLVTLCLVGLIVSWWKRRKKPALPPKTPREIALEELDLIAGEIAAADRSEERRVGKESRTQYRAKK